MQLCYRFLLFVLAATCLVFISCNEPPEITSVTPDCIGENETFEVTLEGTFEDGDKVYVNHGFVDSKLKSDKITFETTSGMATESPMAIIVQNKKGKNSNEVYINIEEDPVIHSIEPTTGPSSGGQKITINGFGFAEDVEAYLGDSKIVIESSTENIITGVTSAHNPPDDEVLVTVINNPETCPASATYQNYAYYDFDLSYGDPIVTESDLNLVAIDDMNGDGQNDIVVVSYDEDSHISTIKAYDGATYDSLYDDRFTLPANSKPSGLILHDFDPDDGKGVDIAVSLVDLNEIAILRNSGTNSLAAFSVAYYSTEPGTSPSAMTIGEFDGDGAGNDLATINYSNTSTSQLNVTILIGNADGTFTTPAQMISLEQDPADMSISSIATTQISGTYDDLLVCNQSTSKAIVLLNNLTAPAKIMNFSKSEYGVGSETEPISIVAYDLGEEGNKDIIVVNHAVSSLGYLVQNIPGTIASTFTSYTIGNGGVDPALPLIIKTGNFEYDPSDTEIGRWGAVGFDGIPGLVEILKDASDCILFTLPEMTSEGEMINGTIYSMAVGNLNNDEIDDVVVGLNGDNKIIVLKTGTEDSF